MLLENYKISEWIEENRADFVPPVCNKCLFSQQIKAFLVGGPNIRKDFHLEEGEELFYMIDGDMCLKTVNGGVIKDIKIKEGQIYMQPGRILHSPQRQADTVGLVVERCRALHELDSLRYFSNEKTFEVCFERWFHLKDAVADLPPIINEYFNYANSEKAKLSEPCVDTNLKKRPYEANNNVKLEEPIYLMDWIKSNAEKLKKNGMIQLYGKPRFKSTIIVYGSGQYEIAAEDGEIFIWFLEGNGSINFHKKEKPWKAVECSLIPIGQKAEITCQEGSYFFTVKMPTPK